MAQLYYWLKAPGIVSKVREIAGPKQNNLPILVLLYGLSQLVFEFVYLTPVPDIDLYSIVAEGTIAISLLILLFKLNKLRESDPQINSEIYVFVFIGFTLQFIALWTDTLDEAFQHPALMTTILEDLFQVTGFIVAIIGIIKWMRFNKLQHYQIEEHKKAKLEITQLRNYLANIINSMPSVLIGVDAECRVTQWNQQAESITGLSYEKVQAKSLADVFPTLTDHLTLILESIRGGQIIRDLKVRFHDGDETLFKDITIFPLVSSGSTGAVIRLDDVTEQVHMEKMMIHDEKMVSLGGMAAGMVHEINNPLASVVQNTGVVKNRLTGDFPANHKAAEAAGTTMEAIRQYIELRQLPDMLDNIDSSGERAAHIVNSMLSFSRKSDKSFSANDLGTILNEAIYLSETDYNMESKFDFKDVQIVREYSETLEPVQCEPSEIQQVFLNLLRNGAEAMAENRSADIQPRFTLRILDEGLWARVEIEDNGEGMSQDVKDHVFDPFFTTKPTGAGTGLGLSVSYFIIVKSHSGKMEVLSEVGEGTKFIIHLPKQTVEEPNL
ncbi:MAG: PAS domain-containing protein [Gammaproteobacteria bacterium]|nr:PAS domain-containing protein [Gammaproteobacteria bacterium]